MWTKKARYFISLSALAFCLLSACVGICSPSRTYTISESELMTLQNHLDALETNNETLKTILTAQGDELTSALNLLIQSQTELMKLRNELKAAKQETLSAQNSLQIANEELRKASESFKAYEKERDKTENRLRNQKNIWKVLCLVAVGVAAAR